MSFATQISVRNLKNSNYLIVIKSIRVVKASPHPGKSRREAHRDLCKRKVAGRHRSIKHWNGVGSELPKIAAWVRRVEAIRPLG